MWMTDLTLSNDGRYSLSPSINSLLPQWPATSYALWLAPLMFPCSQHCLHRFSVFRHPPVPQHSLCAFWIFCCLKMSRTKYPVMQCYISEECLLHPLCYKNLKPPRSTSIWSCKQRIFNSFKTFFSLDTSTLHCVINVNTIIRPLSQQ
jgi:hypothetical protein